MARTTPELNSTLRESILNTKYASQDRYGKVKANWTFDQVLTLIKTSVEGGYSHPVHWYEEVYIKGGTNTVSSGSGETMYGEDRAAGKTEANSDAGKRFWALVDTWSGLGDYAEKNRTYVASAWPAKLGMANPNENYLNFIYRNKGKLKYQSHGAEPTDPVLKEKMKALAREHVRARYDITLNEAFKGQSRGEELKRIINSDGRLMYLFIRLRYNGGQYSMAAGKDLSNFYTNNPNATVDELIDSSLEWKWKYADGLPDGTQFSKKTGLIQQDSKDIIKRDTLIAAEFFGWPRKYDEAPPNQPNSALTTGGAAGAGAAGAGAAGAGQTTDPIAQDKKSGDTEDVTPKQPTGPITQIKRLFKPTIRPIDVELDMQAESLQNKKIIASTLGYTPLIFYNGADIKATDVSSFRLYHEGMLPKIDCVISDTYGIFKKTGIPGDDTKISIFINSKSRILASIRMDFKVLEFAEISPGKYRVSAIVDIPKMYVRKYINFAGKTSLEALQDLARYLGLGFCTNITNTNDKQNWINIGTNQREFINNITQYSYISDTSFQVCYVDYYYNLCFVDISREFERDVNEDVGVSCVGFDSVTGGDKSDDKIESLVLTNERNLSLSSGFIDKYKVTNNSTTVSLKKAYRNDVKYLDIQKKEILYFTVDSQTGDPSKSLVLKASSGDDEFFKENIKSTYGGKLDTNTDGSGNAHANSSYTVVNNMRNLTDFAKINALMYLPNCNLNLYPYRKVKVHIMNPKQTPDDDSLISARLTGDWLISGIEFSLSQGKFRQVLTCLKRELSLTKAEQDSQPVNKNLDQNNFKTDPNPGPILPNSVYKVGEIYTVKDAKGLEYKMTVEAISTDGKEITASVDTRKQ